MVWTLEEFPSVEARWAKEAIFDGCGKASSPRIWRSWRSGRRLEGSVAVGLTGHCRPAVVGRRRCFAHTASGRGRANGRVLTGRQ